MSNLNDERLPGDRDAEALREMDSRLQQDAALWSAGLPSPDGAAERARQTPYSVARPPATDAAVAAPTATHRERNALPTRGDEPMPGQRIRAAGALGAAVVVVALLAALLSALSQGHGTSTTRLGSGNPGGATATPALSAATATSTPIGGYLYNVFLSTRVDVNGLPVQPSGPFLANQRVYISMRVENAPPGQHIVAIRWFSNGALLTSGGAADLGGRVTGNATLWFAHDGYPAGAGMVRILWDPPAGDLGTDPSDPHVLATFDFTVYTAAPAETPTAVPGQTPTLSPGPTPTPGSVGTPSGTPTPSPVG